MSGRCRHNDQTIHYVLVRLRDGSDQIAESRRIVCNRCGEWLSLGHSDETPERVAVEIRAAGMYACHATDGTCNCFCPSRRLDPMGREREARELADEMMWQTDKETP